VWRGGGDKREIPHKEIDNTFQDEEIKHDKAKRKTPF
jgi:hypothetical protein